MNIVWIEDFGGQPNPQGFTTNLFHNLFNDEGLIEFKDWRTMTGKDLLEPKFFRDSLSEYSQSLGSSHHITLLTNYQEYQHWITRDNFELCRDVDVFVIDINLTNEKYQANADSLFAENIDHTRAGLNIYNNLVASRFPNDHICLMTGEDVTLTKFNEMCANACMEPPTSFHKTDLVEYKMWLSELAGADYLRFRRGALAAITWARSQAIANGNTPFCRFSTQQTPPHLTWNQALGYLDGLEALLPYVPDKKVPLTLRNFLRALVHEWDTRTTKKIFKLTSQYPDLCVAARGLIQTRNWLAHGHLLDKSSAQDIAIILIFNFRAMFYQNSRVAIQKYEHDLLRMFNPDIVSSDEVTRFFGLIDGQFNRIHKKLIEEGYLSLVDDKPLNAVYISKTQQSRQFLSYEIANEFAKSKPSISSRNSRPLNLNYAKLLQLYFWLCLWNDNNFCITDQNSNYPWMAEIFKHVFTNDFANQLVSDLKDQK